MAVKFALVPVRIVVKATTMERRLPGPRVSFVATRFFVLRSPYFWVVVRGSTRFCVYGFGVFLECDLLPYFFYAILSFRVVAGIRAIDGPFILHDGQDGNGFTFDVGLGGDTGEVGVGAEAVQDVAFQAILWFYGEFWL